MGINNRRYIVMLYLICAIKQKFPNILLGSGSITQNGFYYDFDFGDIKINNNIIKDIESIMHDLITQKITFDKQIIDIDIITKTLLDNNQLYIAERLNDFKQANEKIFCYFYNDILIDVINKDINISESVSIDSFEIEYISGAYWKNNSKNKMLTRISVLVFLNNIELKKYHETKKNKKKLDHRTLGKDLDLFCFSDLIGPGLPLFTPKGTIIKEELQKYVENICYKFGFRKVITPHLSKIDLYEISGHAKKFSSELFHVSSINGHKFVMKPVQCPHQTQIYASKIRSYRELPIRYMESEKQYRAEKAGEVGGLNRVYAITVEDGHTFCRRDQVKNEIISIINIIKDFYTQFGLWGNHWVSLSVRDMNNLDKYIGDIEDWDICEQLLDEISKEMNLDAKRCEGEAAIYGPKLDFMFIDSFGKEVQIPTVQINFATPKRFDLYYIDKDGSKKTPVMVHRAILGSYERFIALLLEHFEGILPIWLAPVQVKILPISEGYIDYCNNIANKLISKNIRCEVSISDESINKKIRNSLKEKIPYILVIGEQEITQNKFAIRKIGTENIIYLTEEQLIEEILSNKPY